MLSTGKELLVYFFLNSISVRTFGDDAEIRLSSDADDDGAYHYDDDYHSYSDDDYGHGDVDVRSRAGNAFHERTLVTLALSALLNVILAC